MQNALKDQPNLPFTFLAIILTLLSCKF